MKKEKLQKSIIPKDRPSINEWCKEFKVSSRYDRKKLFDMYHYAEYTGGYINKFKKLIK